MEALEVILFVVVLSNLFLGILVFRKDPLKKLNRLFGIFSVMTAFWVFSNLMAGIQPSLVWVKIGYAFGALVPVSAIFWVLELCNKKIAKSKIILQ